MEILGNILTAVLDTVSFLGVFGISAIFYGVFYRLDLNGHFDGERHEALGQILFLLSFPVLFLTGDIISSVKKQRNEKTHFDSRVLSVIEGLYLSGMRFKCADFEMKRFASDRLAEVYRRPDFRTNPALEYTAKNGQVYRAYVSSDHVLFALICVLQYAVDDNNAQLVDQCEELLEDARRATIRR